MPNSLRKTIGFIEPMYALGVSELPEGSHWIYEIKLDGYRCLAGKDARGVSLWSRRGNLLTSQFAMIAKACEHLPGGTLVDGEVIAMDPDGRISFNILQHHRSMASAVRFYAFDILIRAGRNMLHEPLLKRRDALTHALRLVRKASSVVDLSQTVTAPAADLIRAVTELGLEGVVAKHHDSTYESGRRSGAWVKYKINKGQEFVIGGYTPGNPFDAVIVGYYEEGKLLFAGKVRNGFVPHVRREVIVSMKRLETGICPFANLPEKQRRTQWALTREQMKDCVWLKPELVAQIEFTEWTGDGHLRHAAFTSLRGDKNPREVVREPG
jgi:DNA ligase D-like protein (predicted ligase)